MCSVTLNFADWLEAIFWRSFWHIFWHSFWQIFWYIFWHSFWHIFWHSFWHLSDISFDILSDKSFDTLSDISSDILSDISFDMLSDISSDILSDISKRTSTASHKKPLCKLYIYLTPRSKSNIHDNFVPVNVIALSASDRPAKRQLSPKMQTPVVPHTHTTCIRPPRQTAATTTSHGVCKPWSQMLATAVLPPDLHRWPCSARYLSPTHALHPPKTRPKYERLQRASPALARPPHLEQASPSYATYHLFPSTTFFHDKHQIPSMCSARRLHAHVTCAQHQHESTCSATHAQLPLATWVAVPMKIISGRSTTTSAMAAKPNSLPCTKTKLSQQYLLQCAK